MTGKMYILVWARNSGIHKDHYLEDAAIVSIYIIVENLVIVPTDGGLIYQPSVKFPARSSLPSYKQIDDIK